MREQYDSDPGGDSRPHVPESFKPFDMRVSRDMPDNPRPILSLDQPTAMIPRDASHGQPQTNEAVNDELMAAKKAFAAELRKVYPADERPEEAATPAESPRQPLVYENPAKTIYENILPGKEVTDKVIAAIDKAQAGLNALYFDDAPAQEAAQKTAAGMRWIYAGQPGEALPDYFLQVVEEGLVTVRFNPSIPSAVIEVFYNQMEGVLKSADSAGAMSEEALRDLGRTWVEQSPVHQLLESFQSPPPGSAERELTQEERDAMATSIGETMCREFGVKDMRQLAGNPSMRQAYRRRVGRLDHEIIRGTSATPLTDDPLHRARQAIGGVVLSVNRELGLPNNPPPTGLDPATVRYEYVGSNLRLFKAEHMPDEKKPGQQDMYLRGTLRRVLEKLGCTSVYDVGPVSYAAQKISRLFGVTTTSYEEVKQPTPEDFAEYLINDEKDDLRMRWGPSPCEATITLLAALRNTPVNYAESLSASEYSVMESDGLKRDGDKGPRLAADREGAPNHLTRAEFARLEGQVVANVLFDGRTPDELVRAPQRVIAMTPTALAPRAAANDPVALQLSFLPTVFAGHSADVVPVVAGYTVASHKRTPDGRQVVTYARDPAGDPFDGDIVFDDVQRERFGAYCNHYGNTALLTAIRSLPQVTLRSLEEVLRTETRYDLPDSPTPSRVVGGRSYVQCTSADKLPREMLSQGADIKMVRPVSGLSLGESGTISALGHVQTLVVHEGRRYMLDATPTTMADGTTLPEPGPVAPPNRQQLVEVAGVEVPATDSASVYAHSAAETAARAGGEDNVPEQPLDTIRTLTDRVLRARYGLEHNPAYAGPDGVAKFIVERYPMPDDMLREAYGHIARTTSSEASASTRSEIAVSVDRLERLAKLSPAEARQLGLPAYDGVVVQQLILQLRSVHQHYLAQDQ